MFWLGDKEYDVGWCHRGKNKKEKKGRRNEKN